MRTEPRQGLAARSAETGAAAGTTAGPGAEQASQPAAANRPSLAAALGALRCQPTTTASSASPDADDASEGTEPDANQGSAAGTDFFSEMPDEIVAHVAGFAGVAAAARLSFANRRLHVTLHDDKLSARYLAEADRVLSIDAFTDLYGSVVELPRALRLEPLKALLDACARASFPDSRVVVLERILDAAKALPPASHAALLARVPDYFAKLHCRSLETQAALTDEILTQVESLPADACPAWWGCLCENSAERGDPLFFIAAHLYHIVLAGHANDATWQKLERVSRVVAALPENQRGLAMGLVAAAHQNNDRLAPGERSSRLEHALHEFESLPQGQWANALVMLARGLATRRDAVESALKKLFPAIARLEPAHRALPLLQAAELLAFHRAAVEATTAQRLDVLAVFRDQIPQLPLRQQAPIWEKTFEILRQIPKNEQGDMPSQLAAAIDEMVKRHRADSRSGVPSGPVSQETNHAPQP